MTANRSGTLVVERAAQGPHTVQASGAGRTRWTQIRHDGARYLMVLPALALVLLFDYVPVLGNIVAFQSYSPYKGILGSPFNGVANFQRLASNTAFWDALVNTLAIAAVQLVFFFPVPIVLALVLNSLISVRVRTVLQSITYLPHFFSWVIVITVFQQVFGGAGLLAQWFRSRGWEPWQVMTNADTFLALVTAQVVWKDAGWGMVVFLAALAAIDPTQYEAAAVDGANRMRRMWHVTLPALRPVIILLLILRLGHSLTVGFEQLILQRTAVGVRAAEVLDTFVYYNGILNGNWGMAAAAGLIKGLVSLLLVVGANKVAHLFGEPGIYQRGGDSSHHRRRKARRR